MPRVQAYGGPKVKPEPIPRARLTEAPSPEAYGAGLGDVMARLGTQGFWLLEASERQRQDELALLEASRGLDAIEQQVLYSPDKGALNIKGKDTLPLHDKVLEAFDLQADMLAGNLANDRQRLAFERARARSRSQILQSVDVHTMREMASYEAQVVESSLSTSVDLGINNAGHPERLAAELKKQNDIIRQYGPRLGMPPEKIEEQIAKYRNATLEGAITLLTTLRQDRAARLMFEGANAAGQLQGEALTRVTKMVEAASTDAEGVRNAETLWQELGPKGDDDAIEIDKMEAAARERYKDDIPVQKATIAELRSRKQGVDAARTDRREAIAGALWGAVAAGKTFAEVRGMPEWAEALKATTGGQLQAQLKTWFEQRDEARAAAGYAAESRAYTRGKREDEQRENETYALMEHWSQPANLVTLTENKIVAMLPDIGRSNVTTLLERYRALIKSKDAYRDATVDNDLFLEVADEVGLKPYQPSKNPDHKARIGRFRDAAERAIAVEQGTKGRRLTRDEQLKVLRGVAKPTVQIPGTLWGSSPVMAAVVGAKDRGTAFVPFDQIPADIVTAYLGYLAKLPGNEGLSLAELRTRFLQRLEHAFAIHLMGGKGDETRAVLEGKQ
jgi:hypothetical protein